MSDLDKLSKLMKDDWDRRIKHDYRFWMSDGYENDEAMWASGARDLAVLMEGIEDPKGKTYLEVGCGVGRLLKSAVDTFGRVIGIDISSEAIAKARELLGENPLLQLIPGNGVDLQPLPTASVDCVGSFATLCSIPTDVVANYLREMQRVLKPGGEARLQLYIGESQPVTKEDTLHLRCFSEENLRRALTLAGFEVLAISDLVLPVDVSFKELGIEAKIVSARKEDRVAASAIEVSSALLPQGEGEGESQAGIDIEYWMTVNHAKDLAEKGQVERAKQALDYAEAFSKATTIDVRDILSSIVHRITKDEDAKASVQEPPATYSGHTPPLAPAIGVFQANLEVLRQRFPEVASAVTACSVGPDIEVRDSRDGPVLFLTGQCLDHPEKPVSASDIWVKRALTEKRFSECSEVALYGFGCGYHVESFLKGSALPLSVIEPRAEILRAAMESRDLTNVFSRLRHLSVGEGDNHKFDATSELLIRPQSLVVYGKQLSAVKERFYGARGLTSLHPTIMVLGPMQGGTLPITGYTTRALQSLKQRVRELDTSGFVGGYQAIEGILKDKTRQTVMHQNYLEMISQGVLESVNEKRIDILICMAQAPISGRVLTELRNQGVITVLWFMEDYLRFTYWQNVARFYDFVFTIQQGECLDLIKAAGAGEVHYMPVGCDPVIHAPLTLTDDERARWGSPISFVGAGYHNRQQMFASLAELPFKLWGTEWPECRPFDRMVQEGGRRLSPDEYMRIFNATDININLHSSTEKDGVDPNGDFVNPRTFELAAAGAFQLVDERSLLPTLLEPGKEVITFKSREDLREKIEYYSAHPEERRAVAERARERVIREHTYGHRLRDMLSIIYSSKFEQLKNRQDASPWKKMLTRSERHAELRDRCQLAYERGEEPILDGLVVDILAGKGKLTETEQKLLFLYHVRKQIIRMRSEEAGG